MADAGGCTWLCWAAGHLLVTLFGGEESQREGELSQNGHSTVTAASATPKAATFTLVRLRAGDLEPLRALQPHAPADGEEGVRVVEPGEDVHGDRPRGHRGRRVVVVEPADLRIVLLDAVPRALLDREKADIARSDDRCGVLARWREQHGKDEVDLASRIDPVTREADGGQRVQDRTARLGCLPLPE